MRILAIFISSLCLFFTCKARNTASRTSTAQPVKVAQGTGNGLALSGTGFVWEKSGLPICYSARNGAKFFVWKEQATFDCATGQKDWRLVSKKKG